MITATNIEDIAKGIHNELGKVMSRIQRQEDGSFRVLGLAGCLQDVHALQDLVNELADILEDYA